MQIKKDIKLESSDITPEEIIGRKIFMIRNQKVMLDTDLADLYGTSTGDFNRAVKRNVSRFPQDFMFQLSKEELDSLRCQIGISKIGRGGRRYLPYAFTEHGVAMLAAILSSERAVVASIFIVRAFIRLRELLIKDKDFARKIDKLEWGQEKHSEHLAAIQKTLNELFDEPLFPHKKIGFNTESKFPKKN